MKKEIEIKVRRGVFGNPYYYVSVCDTDRVTNLFSFWYTYGSAGEDLANVFRMLRLAGHGDALDRLAHALKMSDPEYNKCATGQMQSREVEFADQWFEKHDKMPAYADAIEWGRKQAVRDACDWLRKTHYIYTESHWCPDEDSMTETPWVTNDFDTVEELIDEFTKDMGEQ
jgi:hypothetical protein